MKNTKANRQARVARANKKYKIGSNEWFKHAYPLFYELMMLPRIQNGIQWRLS